MKPNSGTTIIIPAHNERGCIWATLNSLRQQKLLPDMIVMVDDGSTDGTAVASLLGAVSWLSGMFCLVVRKLRK